jgi:hypothetical protein
MKHTKLFEEFLNEAIASKDWDRMLDLVMKGDDGETAAKLIKDKNKAIARFITGLKLSNTQLKISDSGKYYSGSYSALGNKALELGATPEEIKTMYDATEVPVSYVEKMAKLGGKKLNNRFVGAISKAIIDLGLDITYLPHNGYAITHEGKDAMSRNGRKWTIGYKTEIDLGDKKVKLTFDAITDEGDGPTYYVVDRSSDAMFNSLSMDKLGKNDFISGLRTILNGKKQAA